MHSSSLQGSTVIKQMRHFTGHYKNYGIIGVSKNLLEYQKVMTVLHCSGWLSVCLTASSAGYFVHVLKLMLSFVSFISARRHYVDFQFCLAKFTIMHLLAYSPSRIISHVCR